MKAAGRPALAALRSRGYAAQAAAQASAQPQKQDIEVSRQPNGSVVASVETLSPVSRIGVFFNAGPRYEGAGEKGMSHFLRNAAELTTRGASAFGLVKNMQQMGANLTCTSTRENMIYTVECTRDKLPLAIDFLVDVTCKPAYFPWEVSRLGSSEKFKLDLALLANNQQAQMIEALHKAAFRDGLGNSLFMPSHMLGSISSDMVSQYFLKHYTGGNMALVGVGIDHQSLTSLAKEFKFQDDTAAGPSGSGYHGGEIRVDGKGPLVNLAVVTEGASMESPDVAALSVLQQAMGTTPYIKYSSNNTSSRVGKAAASATSNPVSASCIMSAYSDSGLFGFQCTALAADADKVAKSVMATFAEATKGNLTDADVEVAKAKLRAAYLMWMEREHDMLEDIGTQAVATGQVAPVSAVLQQIDAVTTTDVNKVAKKVINGKPSMAAVGDLSSVPYLDKLF